jgi:flagellar hook-length control protein FliK
VPAPLAVAAALPASAPVAPAPASAPAAAAIPAAPGDHAGVPAPTGADTLPAAPAPAAVPASALPAATPASGLPATPPEPSGAGFPAPATGAPSPTPAEAPTSAPSSAPVAEPAAAPAGGSAPQPAAGPAEPPAEQPGPAPAPTPPAADSRPSAGLESLLRQAAPARGFERAASLERAPRAVAQTIHIATQRGVSHARLNLRPSELGGVEIQLQASAGGVIAQVIADSPEAARALQAAAEDLRRALARQDVTLLSLEVSTSGGEQRDTQGARDGAPHAGAPRAGAGARGTGAVTTLDTHETAEAVIELPDGVLVDVLA